MRIFVTAKTGKRTESVEKIDELHYAVSVKDPAQQGKANEAIIRVLAKYFDVPKSFVIIESGHFSPKKIVFVLSS